MPFSWWNMSLCSPTVALIWKEQGKIKSCVKKTTLHSAQRREYINTIWKSWKVFLERRINTEKQNIKDSAIKNDINFIVFYANNKIYQIGIDLCVSCHDWYKLLEREDFLSLMKYLHNQGILKSNLTILEDLGLKEKLE